MSDYILKDPAIDQDITVLWRSAGLVAPDVVASDLGWTVSPDDTVQGGLSVTPLPIGATTSQGTMTGGRAGHAYQITTRIQSTQGRALQKTVVVRVAEG